MTETQTDQPTPIEHVEHGDSRTQLCERCHGRVSRTRRTTLAQALAVHAATCPASKVR